MGITVLLMAGPVMGQGSEKLLDNLEAIRARYVEANGGEEAVEAIRGVRAWGTLTAGDQSFQITLFKKRPHFKRMIRSDGEFTVDVGYDGTTVWRRIQRGEIKRVEELSGEEAGGFVADNDFDGPLLGPVPAGTSIAFKGVERIDRVPYYVISVSTPSGDSEIYLDSRTFREYKTVQQVTDEEGRSMEVVVLNENYRRVGSMWVAMRMTRLENGEVTSITELENVEMNPGVFDSFFSRPQ